MSYGLVTFRSQPCDKQLNGEFIQLMTPLLNKAEKYCVSLEREDTPDAHYHIVISFKGDISHLRQKFTSSKVWTNWINKTKSTMTIISTPKFEDGALQLKKIKSAEEDLLHTLGYVCKENVVKTKGFTEVQISEAVKYYHTCERKKPDEFKSDWKILNVKSVIPYMEHVAKKHAIPTYHKHVFYYMAKEKMYVDLSNKTKDNIRATLRIAETEQDHYEQEVLSSELNGDAEEGDDIFTLRMRIMKLQKLLKANNIEYYD